MPAYFPLPINLFEVQEIRRMNYAQYGILRLILEDVWENGPDLPKTDFHLSLIARCESGAWKRHGEKVMVVVNKLMPTIIELRAKRDAKRLELQKRCQKMVILKRTAASQKTRTMVDKKDNKTKFTPVEISFEKTQHHQGFYDSKERYAAIKSNRKGKKDEFTFTDG